MSTFAEEKSAEIMRSLLRPADAPKVDFVHKPKSKALRIILVQLVLILQVVVVAWLGHYLAACVDAVAISDTDALGYGASEGHNGWPMMMWVGLHILGKFLMPIAMAIAALWWLQQQRKML